MKYERASKGNTEGIAAVNKESDKLGQKIFMIRKSMSKALKNKAHETGVSESEIVRKALEAVL